MLKTYSAMEGRLDSSVSITFFFCVVSFLKVDISFVSAMCGELFERCYLIQRALYCSFVAMA